MPDLIDQGGFGCIFYPGYNCSNVRSNNKKYVSKLQLNDFNAKNEIYIGTLIKEISNYKLYFLPVIKSCSISLASLTPSMIDKCNIIDRDIDTYLLLQLPYIKNISFKELFSDKDRTTRHLFLTFIETYKYISISIDILLQNNIVHFDIKDQNILYSIKYENPILIDFGLSIPLDKLDDTNLNNYFYIYSPDYYLWCLEIHVINYVLYKGVLTEKSIDILIKEYIKNNSGMSILSDNFKDSYFIAAKNFFMKYVNVDSKTTIKELLLFANTWDLYSLSILYLRFLKLLFNNKIPDSELINKFSQLLLTNISPNPNNRLSSKQTQRTYSDIFYTNVKLNDYLTLIKVLNN